MNFPKFFPRIQKFLTENPCYTAEKTNIKRNFYVEFTLAIYFRIFTLQPVFQVLNSSP